VDKEALTKIFEKLILRGEGRDLFLVDRWFLMKEAKAAA